MSFRSLRKWFVSGICLLLLQLFFGCNGKVLTYEQQLLGEADSLFRAGNYEFAKLRFDKIRTLKPESASAKIATYYLGYINVYYDNPFASPEAALREFKMYVSLYPNDARVDEVNSWIKLLVVMQSFEKDYRGSVDSLVAVKNQQTLKDQAQTVKKNVSHDSISILNDVVRKSYHLRDSLSNKNKELENFILDLEKKCQEAGQ